MITYDIDVSASSNSNRTEPTLVYEPSQAGYNINDAARQLGASKDYYSNEDRGILSLDIRSLINKEKWQTARFSTTSLELLHGIDQDWSSHYGDWQICTRCGKYGLYDGYLGYTRINLRHAALVQGIFESTLDPSLAVQTYIFAQLRMAYYEFRSSFTNYKTITTTSFESRSFPQRGRGITIVIITISVHFALIILVAILFCTGTRYSLLDNAWPTISQLATSTTEDIFRVSTLAKDYDVQRMLSRSDIAQRRARIGPVANSGRIGLVE